MNRPTPAIGNQKPEAEDQRGYVPTESREADDRSRNRRARGRLTALCLLTSALGLLPSGCVRDEPHADIVTLNGAEPESLDPAVITIQPDGRIVPCLFEGLTRRDPKTAAPIPALATHWEISD